MNCRILELAEEITELNISFKNSERKQKWIAHNNLERNGDILVNVHFWKNVINSMWKELLPDSEIMSISEEESFVPLHSGYTSSSK